MSNTVLKRKHTLCIPKQLNDEEFDLFKNEWRRKGFHKNRRIRYSYATVTLKQKGIFNPHLGVQYAKVVTITYYCTEERFIQFSDHFKPEGDFGRLGFIASTGGGFVIVPDY
jgi:hypothetical protein